MKHLSPGRTALGLGLTFGGAFLTAFAYSWGHPPLPPDTTTIGELGAHLSRCGIAGLNAAMLALPGWLTGWAIRSTHDGKLLVWKADEPEPVVDEVPRNWAPVTMSATVDRPSADEVAAALETLRRASGDKPHA